MDPLGTATSELRFRPSRSTVGTLRVLLSIEAGERPYIVVDTKSGLFQGDLRDKEWAKIACDKANLGALRVSEQPAEYVVARSLDDLLNRA